jgi:ribosome biogenesis GTPase / thiamine phosphate phosphatase
MTNRRRRTDSYDEDDVRIRPGRGKSRPRSKDRPSHAGASTGFVTAVDRGRFTVVMDDDPDRRGRYAVKARELGRKGLAVGDYVACVGDLDDTPDALARIVRREPRRTVLRRTADDTDPVERVLVVNADQLAVVVALADPEPQPRLIDRALVAAFDGGLQPLLVLTKSDLTSPEALLGVYSSLGVPYVVTQRGGDLAPLRARLRDVVTVMFGSSGVGKSTLVNALVPSAERATGSVNVVTGRGRHTSSSAIALALPGGGWVVDTPGIRSLGLAHVDVERFMHAFPDLEAGTAECPRGCGHDDEHCALDAWVAAGQADPARLASLRRLLASRSADDVD